MQRINVTKTFLPPIDEYEAYIRKIWESDQLTNQGPLLKEFEKRTQNFLDAQHLHFVSNGTIALQLALRALDITEGEVITTPFSYVATTSAILWEKCDPVFVDIDPETFCIDPDKIEAAITNKTRAIMPVHVFGNACDIKKIGDIAKKYNLKVIYDAAHAFGTTYDGRSLLNHGDISICSFHATKLFHTIEGGCLVTASKETSDKLELIKRFGHNGDDHQMLGINAKASEFQAAMGLCNLNYVNEIIQSRKLLSDMYDSLLGINFQTLKRSSKTGYNYAYYPIVLEDEKKLLATLDALAAENIFPRRYFFPSLNELPYISNRQSCPISEDISRRILCLPLYSGLEEEAINRICEVIKR